MFVRTETALDPASGRQFMVDVHVEGFSNSDKVGRSDATCRFQLGQSNSSRSHPICAHKRYEQSPVERKKFSHSPNYPAIYLPPTAPHLIQVWLLTADLAVRRLPFAVCPLNA